MADLSDDLTQVDQMYELYLQGFDLVCGSRYMKGGRLIGGPFLKQLMSRVSGLTLHYFRGVPTHDATNSFKLYDAAMVRDVKVESVAGFELGLELTVKAFLTAIASRRFLASGAIAPPVPRASASCTGCRIT